MNAVAARLGADIDHRIAGALGSRQENLVLTRQAHAHGVDQDVAVVAFVEIDFAAHGGHAHALAIAADARHHARHQVAGLGVAGFAEAQRVHHGDGARAHGEDVAHDAAHAGCRTLIRLNERRMVVAFHLEDAGIPVADVDHAGILAGALDHPGRLGRQLLQMHAGGLVRAMFGPHHAENAQLDHGGLAAHQFQDARIFGIRKPMLADHVGCYFGHVRFSIRL